jgi:hypothetical protein
MAAKNNVKGRSKCNECNKVVGDKDNGVQCEICEGWFHCKCQDMPVETYNILSEDENIHWFCNSCNKGVSKILQTLTNMQVKQDKMEAQLETLKVELESMKVDIGETKGLTEQVETKLTVAIEAKLVEDIDERVDNRMSVRAKNIKEDIAENIEIDKRKNNLIFHGVKESGDGDLTGKHPDLLMVEEILGCGLKLDASRHVEEVSRVGRFVDGKIRPVRVKLRSVDSRNTILTRGKELKDCDAFKRVYISPDLTQKQQKVDKDLRERVKKFREDGEVNAKIKAGKVIKNGRDGQVIVLYQPSV